MYSLKQLAGYYGYSEYIWVDVLLIAETQKAILIMFDGKKSWFPKAWLKRIKCKKDSQIVSIKISLYYWERKFR